MNEISKKVVRKAADNKYAAPKRKVDDARLRRAKKLNVATSTTSGALGVGALGALAASRAPSLAPRIGMSAARAQRIKSAGDKATVPLSAASLGVGGVGSLNFARVQNQEANKLPKLSDLKRKNVKKSYGADFGLSGVSQGRGNAELIYKAQKRDYSGAATGAGAAVAGTGAAGVGNFSYRIRNHRNFASEVIAGAKAQRNRPGSMADHYWRGTDAGKVVPEHQVIRQLKGGRKIAGAALVGGGALASAGINQRRKNKVSKAKKDSYYSDAAIAGGVGLAGATGAGSLMLDSQGRKWAARAADTLSEVQAKNPVLGGHRVRERPETKAGKRARKVVPGLKTPTAFSGVPDVIPKKSSSALMRNDDAKLKEALKGSTKEKARELGRLRGAAGQHRYFAGAYGQGARALRNAGKVGGGIAALGVGGKILQRGDVKKSYGADFGLSGVNQGVGNIEKAYYDPERSRERRMDNASIAMGAGAGAAGASAVSPGRAAAQAWKSSRAGKKKYGDAAAAMLNPNSGQNNLGALRAKAVHGRATWARDRKLAAAKGGKAAGLAALSGGLLVGADQVQRYKRGKGQPYNARQW